ncbi:O-antigen export system permease protein RfbD [Burkholderia singularis]|uniref:Transport permease protein n=2 Tax=Burkholderia singularis TaxID=1503053 RepID=A0A238H7X9_9BURK|nr:O-antigen export system permease protein RfbD [Burkholderia singularis]
MAQREVIGRYRGSIVGLAWSFFTPVLMLTVYTFFFSVVFKARWGTASDDKSMFAVVLFVGLILHGLLAECINRAPTLILANVNYVKKVVFPLEILPIVALGSALFHSAISLLVLLTAELLFLKTLPWTAVVFPLVLLPLLLASLGLAWFLSALGVYVRDISQITGVLTSVLMFLSPVFYPVSNLPSEYQSLIKLNPLTFIIEEGRNTLIFGHLPDWNLWLINMFGALAILWFGFWWFQRTRKGFADVL